MAESYYDQDTLHRQVHIQHGKQSADVDEGIADLILALWRRGYRTLSSCEAQPDTEVTDGNGIAGPGAWIGFTTYEQARIVAQHVGGAVGRLRTEDFENAYPDDPALEYPNLGIVTFPADVIEPVLATVKGKAAPVGAKPKKLPRAPKAAAHTDKEAS